MEPTELKSTSRLNGMSTEGYAAMSIGQPLEPYKFTAKALRPMEVEIEITHCRICHTDLHLINNDFGMSAGGVSLPLNQVISMVKESVISNARRITVCYRQNSSWKDGPPF